MRYFGERSLSSLASRILDVFFYLALLASLLAFVLGAINLFSPSFGEPASARLAGGGFLLDRFSPGDRQSWYELRALPLFWKLAILPYFVAVDLLFLLIVRKTGRLLANFRRDLVFSGDNVSLIAKISRLNIGLAALTANIASFLVSLMLVLVCEILKKGAVLQEEHDLTV
jgi:hypothetical protein